MKTAILLMAHNEEKNIERTINLVKGAKSGARLLLINDGSTDKTGEIARKMGVRVIDLPKNMGKAYGFFTGIRELAKSKPDVVVSMDCDLVKLDEHGLRKLMGVTHESRKPTMDVAIQKEADGSLLFRDSGFRSFNSKAIGLLSKIRLSRFEKKTKGYALEAFLNFYFNQALKGKAKVRQFGDEHMQVFKTKKPFRANQAGRRGAETHPLRRAMLEMISAVNQTQQTDSARKHFQKLAEKIEKRKTRPKPLTRHK